ncbi:hypothetical protein [Sulfurospirillum barnesii]|uniref:YtxH-like protein n=1 Tax=Sulfurospirillum barnesii (strain ATCC 700032 / DSM 10660 / SES-3) TaxID=760154 RepID=I3XY63_SULBS|nr:hypothetical protein [Sulfurospirillum barnesii]AFL68887.1 hypothetical protein Sulba_1599 [Sulfurospirillum barnesii SES-3]
MELPSLANNPYIAKENTAVPSSVNSLLGTFDTKHFVIGAVVGALGAYLLTNEKAQKALFKTVAKGTQAFQAGIEEIKERYEDAQAELAAGES